MSLLRCSTAQPSSLTRALAGGTEAVPLHDIHTRDGVSLSASLVYPAERAKTERRKRARALFSDRTQRRRGLRASLRFRGKEQRRERTSRMTPVLHFGCI